MSGKISAWPARLTEILCDGFHHALHALITLAEMEVLIFLEGDPVA